MGNHQEGREGRLWCIRNRGKKEWVIVGGEKGN